MIFCPESKMSFKVEGKTYLFILKQKHKSNLFFNKVTTFLIHDSLNIKLIITLH